MKRRITTTIIALGLLLGVALWSVGRNVNAAAAPAVSPAMAPLVTNTNDSGPGSLREAIASAASGDTINFSLSGCPCTITLTSGQLFINKNLTIQGLGANLLAVSGNNTSRVFGIDFGSTVTLDGLTIKDGDRGIVNFGTLTVSNSTVSNNSAHNGGILSPGTLTVSNSTVSNNIAASEGGGIYNGVGRLIVSNSTVSNNLAGNRGGGIFTSSNSMAVSNSPSRATAPVEPAAASISSAALQRSTTPLSRATSHLWQARPTTSLARLPAPATTSSVTRQLRAALSTA